MKKLILLGFAMAVFVGNAGAVSVQRTKRSLIAQRDASGNPIVFAGDKAWKVFELKDTTTETQVSDESAVAPVFGILHKVCVESAPSIAGNSPVAVTDWALVWDTTTATGAQGAGRRLLPPLMRATAALVCSPDLDVLFSLGLRVANGGAAGSTYVYWRGLGDIR